MDGWMGHELEEERENDMTVCLYEILEELVKIVYFLKGVENSTLNYTGFCFRPQKASRDCGCGSVLWSVVQWPGIYQAQGSCPIP